MHRHFGTRLLATLTVAAAMTVTSVPVSCGADEGTNQVLEWNQILVDTLVLGNAVNAASPRLSAIVHTAIFDAYNGIERRYTPIYVRDTAPRGASRRAAVIAAAYTTLHALFPSRQADLDASYTTSLAALTDDEDDDGGRSREQGIAWGVYVANAVLAWRATDGFSSTPAAFRGGTAVGQWRPTPPALASMASQTLAFTQPFVLESATQFRPPAPRGLLTSQYTDDFKTVKQLGRATGSTRTDDQTALAPFWDGNASVHWNQAANQMARANGLSMSRANRLLAVLNLAMADTMFTIWNAKRYYAQSDVDVTWRPITAIALADTDANPGTDVEATWAPLMNTPSHPEYPAGHPSQNGAAAAVLLSCFDDAQVFTLTTRSGGVDLPSRTYSSISQARADGNAARIWGGMHYPSTVAISSGLGETIAEYVNRTAMQPVRDVK